MSAQEPKIILLVEDEEISARVTAKILKSFGLGALIANTGEAACEIALGDEKIDLILMDIDLGSGIDGTEAARRILEKRHVPIIFMTAHTEKEYAEKIKKVTRYGYVVKNSGVFVLRSSIEMAFELFDAHENIKKELYESKWVEDLLKSSRKMAGTAINDQNDHDEASELRRLTEEKIKGAEARSNHKLAELSNKLIYELCVNKIELEKQNEQLHRVQKELQAFYNLTEITSRKGITLDEIYQQLAEILPQSWFYPEIACARIFVGEDEFRSKNFIETAWKQSAPFKVNGESAGKIDICYIEERMELDEGPFMKEERLLIDAIADRLGHIIEHKRAAEENKVLLAEKQIQNKELLLRKKTYKDIIDNLSEGYVVFDLNGKIAFANRRILEMLGLASDEVIGKDATDFFVHIDQQERAASIEKLKRGERVRGELKLKHKEGKIIVVNRVTSMLFDLEGKITGYFTLITDLTENIKLKQELDSLSREGMQWKFHDIIGISPSMKETFRLIETAAGIDCNVFIEGSSGTGKSLIAKTIHELSARKDGPFIVVNCGAIPEGLIESELFGYVKGAFTDAKTNKPGRFTLADRGTIFLDEISEMPYNLQVKLLRVIEEKKYEPLGSGKTIEADVRVIAATNRNIAERIKDGMFREDLYYRLKIIGIKILPLCERSEDIMFMVSNLIEKLNRKYSKSIKDVCAKIRAFFQNYEFPGNVRELQNIIESAFVTCAGDVISLNDLPAEYRKLASVGAKVAEDVQQLRMVSELTEISTIISALERSGNDNAAAAKMLNIGRTTLWRKMKKYNLT